VKRGLSLAPVGLLLGLCAHAFAAGPLSLWLDVPFVKQPKNGCGPASIAMVMGYWQARQPSPRIDAAEVVRDLQPQAAHGLRASEMVRSFEQRGFRAFAYASDWSEMEHELQMGRPLIAALKPEGGSELHYVVVVGVDDGEKVILLNDPAQRKLLKEDRAQFEREWNATNNWTLLAVPANTSH
jgi:ABC-type bacteriocin/lantibiotic exporter with double-glycine peptidase domain